MRAFFTSLMAFFVSGFAGGMVAQVLAETTNATEEFILVFMLSALVTIVVTLVFFVAQLLSRPALAIAACGKWLLIVFGALSVALIGLALMADGLHVPEMKEVWIIVGLVVPGLVTIVTHWAFVRWRLPRPALGFGRGAA